MRLAILVGLTLLIVGPVAAQDDDLGRLMPDGRIEVDLDLHQVPVSAALEALAGVAGLQVYFDRDVALDGREVSISFDFFDEGDLATILRALLDGHDLTYRAVDDDTILITSVAPNRADLRHGPLWLADRNQVEVFERAVLSLRQ